MYFIWKSTPLQRGQPLDTQLYLQMTHSIQAKICRIKSSEIRVFGVAQLTDRYCANLPQKSLTTT
jgi:hypothetical protein